MSNTTFSSQKIKHRPHLPPLPPPVLSSRSRHYARHGYSSNTVRFQHLVTMVATSLASLSPARLHQLAPPCPAKKKSKVIKLPVLGWSKRICWFQQKSKARKPPVLGRSKMIWRFQQKWPASRACAARPAFHASMAQTAATHSWRGIGLLMGHGPRCNVLSIGTAGASRLSLCNASSVLLFFRKRGLPGLCIRTMHTVNLLKR